MLTNYVKTAWRNLLKQRVHSLINIVGLAMGMACALLIFLFVEDELSYDTFHENADRIYRLTRVSKIGDNTFAVANTASAMGPALQKDYPVVEKVVRVWRTRPDLVLRLGENKFPEHGYFVDETVFDVFTFPLKTGDARTALREPATMVISQQMAKKYFGESDPVGKVISIDDGPDFRVTGVLYDLPGNSHFNFAFLASMASFQQMAPGYFKGLGAWFNNGFYTYLLLHPNQDVAGFKNQLPNFVQKYMAASFADVTKSGYALDLELEPLTDIYLRSDLSTQLEPVSEARYVYIFSAIAFFILLIGCINFINLATARSNRRAPEVGMRKVMGASRAQLISQLVCESTLLSIIALFLALGLVELLLPFFNHLTGKSLAMYYFTNTFTWLGIIGITLLTGLLAGSYPSLLLSAYQPAKILRGSSGNRSQRRLRKTLVVLQFTISIALIVGTAIIGEQLHFMQNKELGFNKDHLVVLPIKSDGIKLRYETLRTELLQNPNVIAVTAASGLPGQRMPADSYPIFPAGKEGEDWAMRTTMVDYDFLKTMRIKLISGRDFSRQFPADAGAAFILNESAVRALGWNAPLGQKLVWEAGGPNGVKVGQVIGVVEDYHYESLHKQIDPLILHIEPKRFSNLAVRIRSENSAETLAFLEGTLRQFDAEQVFEHSFLDENLTHSYSSESKLGEIVRYFSSLAIFIAGLGLLGLAAFTAEQRTKEVGVRKVLGASAFGLVGLLSSEFVKLVLLANLIAWPIAYYTLDLWLQNFAYRIEIEWWLFALAGGLALLIALLTVSTQAIRAALANPVESLRYE